MFLYISLLFLFIVQCTNYDDEWIRKELASIEERLDRIERNYSDLLVYESIFKNGKLILDVKDNGDGSFTLFLTDMTSVTIACPAGKDGKNGKDGVDGIDAIAPDFKIENSRWYVSYDGGTSWHEVGSALSDDSLLFRSVYITGDFLVFVLVDGTVIKIKYFSKNTYSIENDAVNKYLKEVFYEDFNESVIENYAQESGYRMDYPLGCTIKDDSLTVGEKYIISVDDMSKNSEPYVEHITWQSQGFEILNLAPLNKYEVIIREESTGQLCSCDTIFTKGQVRMLKSVNAWNMRDIGGWSCNDGRTVAYGKIFRGGAFRTINKEDWILFCDRLGIKTEIDLRSDDELRLNDDDNSNNLDYSLFGETIDYYHCALPLSDYLFEASTFVNTFKLTLNSLRESKPVFIHCAGGADRTGSVIILFEALLGVIDSDIAKDFELTSFAPKYYDKDNYRYCTRCKNIFSVFAEGEAGTSNQIIAEQFLKRHGVTESDIMEFRDLMLR